MKSFTSIPRAFLLLLTLTGGRLLGTTRAGEPAAPSQAAQAAASPQEVLVRLTADNARFAAGKVNFLSN